VSRPKFRESDVMEAYIQAHMRGIGFTEAEFRDGAWLERLPELLALGRIRRDEANGAEQAARFLLAHYTTTGNARPAAPSSDWVASG